MKFVSVFLVIVFVAGVHSQASGRLRLSFEAADGSVCIEDSMEFVTKITNEGKIPVAIDLNLIGSVFSFAPASPRTGGDFLIHFGKPTHYQPRFFVLKPGASLSKIGSLDFTREKFPRAGRYKMQVGSSFSGFEKEFQGVEVWDGTIYSNKKLVLVRDCGGK